MKKVIWSVVGASLVAGLAAGCFESQKNEATAPAAEPAAAAVEPAAAVAAAAEPAAPEAVAEPAAPEAVVEPAAAEPAAAVVADEAVDESAVVAKVNGTEILEGEVEKVLKLIRKQMEGRLTDEQAAAMIPRVKSRIVDELIMRQIMRDAVAAEGVTLSDEELESVKAELSAELPPGMTLESYMEETGTDEADFREQMTIRKLVMTKVKAAGAPTEEEVRAFYDENRPGFQQDESVTASHILVKFDAGDDDAAKAEKLAKIEGLKKQLEEGADFAELAKANSDCPSSQNGGDLGTFGRGQMVAPFEDAAFRQEVGKVGDVVETQFGYHLILVTGREEGKTLEYDEVKERIAEMLLSQKQQKAAEEYLHSLEDAATVERFDGTEAEGGMDPQGFELDVEDEEVDLDAEPEAAAAEEAAEEKAEAVAADLEESAKDAMAGIADAISETAEAVEDKVAEVAENAAEVAEGVAEGAKEAAADVAEKVEEALGGEGN